MKTNLILCEWILSTKKNFYPVLVINGTFHIKLEGKEIIFKIYLPINRNAFKSDFHENLFN